MLLKINL